MRIVFHKPPHGPPMEEKRLLHASLDEIRRERNLAVEFEQPSWTEWRSRLSELREDGNPHLIYIPGGWLPSLAKEGLLENLSDRFPERVARWKSRYPEEVFRWGAWEGAQFGIPVYGAVWCFMYNGQLFEQAGISRAPRTWEELRECALTLQRSFPGVCPYGLNDDTDGHFIDHGYIYLFAGGRSRWLDGLGKLHFDNDGAVEGLSFLRELVERGLANVPSDSPSNRIAERFLTGKIAMTVGPSDWILLQRKVAPAFPFKVAMMPCPQGESSLSFAFYGFYCLMAENGAQEAVQLLEELIHPDRLKKHIHAIGMLPVQDGMYLYENDAEMGVFSRQIKYSGHFPPTDLDFTGPLTREMLSCLRLEKCASEALRGVTELMNAGGLK